MAATRCPGATSQVPALLPDRHQPTARRLNFLVFWQAGAGLVLAKQRQLTAWELPTAASSSPTQPLMWHHRPELFAGSIPTTGQWHKKDPVGFTHSRTPLNEYQVAPSHHPQQCAHSPLPLCTYTGLAYETTAAVNRALSLCYRTLLNLLLREGAHAMDTLS